MWIDSFALLRLSLDRIFLLSSGDSVLLLEDWRRCVRTTSTRLGSEPRSLISSSGPHRISIFPETRALASHFGFDPMALIASGALLIGVAARDARKLVATLKRRKIASEIIGEVLPKKFGTRMVENGREKKVRYPRQDEIARLLASAP